MITQIVSERAERILTGWLDNQTIQAMLSGPEVINLTDGPLASADAARSVVAARPIGVDQTEVLRGEPPPEVQAHVEALRAAGTAAPWFNEGWSVQMVDLRKVVSVQPSVAVESALTRTAGLALPTSGASRP